MRNKAVFYCGTNGAGKSTLRSLNRDEVSVVIDSDHIALKIAPENPRSADMEAGRKAIALFRFATQNGVDFSMESTLSGKSVLQRMADAKNAGFAVRLNYIGVKDPAINIARVHARVSAGGHSIPTDVVARRYETSLKNLPSAILLSDEIMVYDNSGEYPDLIFHIENNQIAILSENIPKWCRDLHIALSGLGFQTIPHSNNSGETT